MLSLLVALSLGQSLMTLQDPANPRTRVTFTDGGTRADGGTHVGLDVFVLNPSGGGGGGSLTDAELRATAVPVSGSLTCSGPVTDAQLRASAVPVSGSFFQTTQPVSLASMPTTAVTGTFFQATQPISAASLPTHPVTQGLGEDGGRTWGVNVANFPASQAVTGTFFQGTQPVSGTLTCNAGSGTLAVSLATAPALVASSAVIGHVVVDTAPTTAITVASLPTHGVTGTFWQSTQPVQLGSILQFDGGTTLPVSLSTLPALTAGSAVIGHVVVDTAPVTHAIIDSSAAIGVTGPLTDTQLRATAVPVSGTVTASVTGATLAAGSAVIGHVIVDTASTTAVTQATGSNLHAVIDTGSTTACTQATGSNLHVVVDTAPTTAVTLASTTITGTPAVSLASTTITGNVAVTHAAASISGSNPCINPTATVLGVSVATSGTASVQLVALSGTTKVYVCSLNVTGVSGTTPTFKLTYGTGTACAVGTTGIVGPFTTTANTNFLFTGPTFAVTPAGQALCYVQTGTTPISTVNLTYAQQ